MLKPARPIVMAIALAIAITTGGCSASVRSTGAESLRLMSASQAEVDYVVDGDTLSIRQAAGSLAYVRLVGIDTPEEVRHDYPTECGAEEAARSMQRLAPDGAVAVLRRDSVADATDSYGRVLAHVVVNGRQLEIAQLRRGWAYVYRYDDQHFDGLSRFERAERNAREARLGVWGRCNGDFHSAEPGLQP
jgi:endonuclease YncB( thermonuclease family)